MSRCEGYYRLENRRCDRDATAEVAAGDGETYAVCTYHGRDALRTQVARWEGDSGVRRSRATALAADAPDRAATRAAA